MVKDFDIFKLNSKESSFDFGQNATDPNLGRFLCIHPPDQHIRINPTSLPGETEKVYLSFSFFMINDGYNLSKFKENINISPADQAMYQQVEGQRLALEDRIKQGLISISQSVADYELILHDLREYKRFLMLDENGEIKWFKKAGKDKKGKTIWKEGNKKDGGAKIRLTDDEHTLKTIFAKEVDYHTGGVGGQGGAGRLSMEFMRNQNILPTLVEDFMSMDTEDDLDKGKLKELSKVEKDLLRSKRRAYEQWKTLFVREVVERYNRLDGLVKSRKKTIDEYKEWLKPVIARYRLLEEALSSAKGRGYHKTHFISMSRKGTVYSSLQTWYWKPFKTTEFYKRPGELVAQKPILILDDWTKREMIFDKENGLITKYPWITEKWLEDQLKFMTKSIKTEGRPWIIEDNDYYTFFILDMIRTNMKTPDGKEMEDTDFIAKAFMMSKNMLFVKLLELQAEKEKFERYLNDILGIENKIDGQVIRYRKSIGGRVTIKEIGDSEITKDDLKKDKNDYVFSSLEKLMQRYSSENYAYVDIPRDPFKHVRKFFNYFGIKFQFRKHGDYERDFNGRITHFYLKEMGQARFFPKVINGLKKRIEMKWV